jgi:hypothetical protein
MIGSQYPEAIAKYVGDSEMRFAVIKNPRVWRPFGLIEPLYWLCTGKRNPDLEL